MCARTVGGFTGRKPDVMALTDKQIALAKLLARIVDRPTKEEAAKTVGYSRKYVYALQHNEEWLALRAAEREKNISGLLYEADNATVKGIRNGDTNCIRLAYQRCGVIGSGTKVETHVHTNGDSFGERLAAVEARRSGLTPN